MKQYPVFSIITITYNAGECIERTIQSIINQSYSNIEYIIIDGKSTDNTLAIIEKYKEKITCSVSEPDSGLYDAMNKGLRKATGDYVWFINAGDTLPASDIIDKILLSIDTDKLPDIIYGDAAIVDEQGKFKHLRRLRPPETLNWKSFRKGMIVCHQAFIAKRAIAPNYDMSYRFSADFDWCIQCMKNAAVIYNSRLILADYMDGGLTIKNHKASLLERFRIMVNYYGAFSVILFHFFFAIRFLKAKIQGQN